MLTPSLSVRAVRGFAPALVLLGLLLTAPGVWAYPNTFDYTGKWAPYLGIGQEKPLIGNFNGDAFDDVALCLGDTQPEPRRGQVLVAPCDGHTFGAATQWIDNLCYGNDTALVGNFDGDTHHRDDLAVVIRSAREAWQVGDVIVAISNGTRFLAPTLWLHGVFANGETPLVGDFNGDGKDDLVCFVKNTRTEADAGRVAVTLSNGAHFLPARRWHDYFCVGAEAPRVGDFNGDGCADIATCVCTSAAPPAAGRVYVALSNGHDHFGASQVWASDICLHNEVLAVGDFNADGKADLIEFTRGTPNPALGAADPAGDVYTALSDGTRFGKRVLRHPYFCVGDEVPAVGEFDARQPQPGGTHWRQRDDLITFVRDTQGGSGRGNVYVALSTFGCSTTFHLKLDRLIITQQNESSGDEPYVTIGAYRVRPGTPGSAQIQWTGLQGAIGDNAPVGSVIPIPPSEGEMNFVNVTLPTKSQLAAHPPELLAISVSCAEHDWSGWDGMRDHDQASINSARQLLEDRVARQGVGAAANTSLLGECLAMLMHFTPRDLFTDNDDPLGVAEFFMIVADPECTDMVPPVDMQTSWHYRGSLQNLAFNTPGHYLHFTVMNPEGVYDISGTLKADTPLLVQPRVGIPIP